MCCICTHYGPGSTRCYTARGASNWRAALSIFCPPAHCSIWRDGPNRTFSRISATREPASAAPEFKRLGGILGKQIRANALDLARASRVAESKSDLCRDLDVARRVIRSEIAGLEQLARALDEAF